ncbi:MAG: RcpC/CpaB family pilus assembly protein [Actinomycetota bacterium]
MSAVAAVPLRVRRLHGRGAHLVMVLAGLVGLVLTLAVLRHEPRGPLVAVAARDLVAGTPLRSADVRFEAVRASGAVLAHLVADGAGWRGRVLTTSLPAGTPLTDGVLRDRVTADGLRAMSIPIDRARAVNGRLMPGDRIDVVRARDGVATVVAPGLEVLEVTGGDARAFGAVRGQITVTVAVDVVDSQRLAAVLADGDFVLTRVTGAVPASGAPPLVLDGIGPGRERAA